MAFPQASELFTKYPPQKDHPDEWVEAVDLYVRLIPDRALFDLRAELTDLMSIGVNEDELFELMEMTFGVDPTFPAHFRVGSTGPSGWLIQAYKRAHDSQRERRLTPQGKHAA